MSKLKLVKQWRWLMLDAGGNRWITEAYYSETRMKEKDWHSQTIGRIMDTEIENYE